MELPTPIAPTQARQVGIAEATASFLAFKARRSTDVRRKAKLILGRLTIFLERQKKFAVAETFNDLDKLLLSLPTCTIGARS
jgi:hypothetical protein